MTLTTKEKIAIMQAFEDGKLIEVKLPSDKHWFPVTYSPKWNWSDREYRIALTQPNINWDHVAKEFNFLMRRHPEFGGGGGMVTSHRPRKTICGWDVSTGLSRSVLAFDSYDPGTCDWQDSLVVRPGYVEDPQ